MYGPIILFPMKVTKPIFTCVLMSEFFATSLHSSDETRLYRLHACGLPSTRNHEARFHKRCRLFVHFITRFVYRGLQSILYNIQCMFAIIPQVGSLLLICYKSLCQIGKLRYVRKLFSSMTNLIQ